MPTVRERAIAMYQEQGPPLDVTAVREVGWRKTAGGSTAWLVDFTTTPGTETPVVETAPTCPRCGEPMERRTNRKTGSQFYGCPNYPECKGTRPI